MKIAFLGDIAFLGQFDVTKNPNVYERLALLKSLLGGFDLVIANLELPLTDHRYTATCKSMHLKASPDNVTLMKYLGISAVSLANNHIADYGVAGIGDTIRVLNSAGIAWYGIAGKTWHTSVDGEDLSFSGYCCYSTNGTHYGKRAVNPLNREVLEAQLDADTKQNELSVVSLHWGMEHTNYPASEHIQLMHHVLENRHALVVGHHPHIIQGIERIKDSVVAYSLGNALFDSCRSVNGKLTVSLNDNNRKCLLLGTTVSFGKIAEITPIGFYLGEKGVEPYDVQEDLLKYSEAIENVTSEEYEFARQKQFREAIHDKFGDHNLSWVLTRLNYYAVGAKLSAAFRQRKYNAVKAQF